jgi:rubrerythrin
MRDFWTADDVLDFAIEREIEAAEFYADWGKKVEKSEMREALERFAREEQGHRRKLEAFRAGIIELNEEEVGNLGIAEHVEGGEPQLDMSYKEALIFAMKKENEAFELYTGLAKAAQDKKVTEMFSSLAREEAQHKLRFELEYDLTTF